MANKLLLIKDVDNLGRQGEIVSVKPGFARNFLLPKKFALIANKNTLKMQEKLQEERKKQAAIDKKDSEELAKKFEGLVVTATVKVDPEGHMYGSVSANDIVKLLQEQHTIELQKNNLLLKQPVKEIGVREIELKLKEDVAATFTLKIVAEGVVEEEVQPKQEENVDTQVTSED